MKSRHDSWGYGAALPAGAATAVMVWFGTGLRPWWPLLWFAPLPVLLMALRSSARRTALLAALAWLAGSLNLWLYFHEVLHMPARAWAPVFLVPALVFAAAVLLFRALMRRGAWWSALLAFPAAWVSFEYLVSLISPHGTAGGLAYTQLNLLPLLQLASLAGPWGMSFVLLFFPAMVAASLHLRNVAPEKALRVLTLGLGAIVLVLAYGAIRFSLPSPGPEVKVGLIASDAPGNVAVADESASSERLFGDYAAAAEGFADRGAQVIVLPEKLGVVTDSSSSAVDAIFQSLADKTKAQIVVGVVRVSPPAKYNEARIYAPGAPPLTYHKRHLLPPFESALKPGDTLTLLPEASGTWGVAICKDMDFTPLAREYGRAGAGLMLVPGWDFGVDRRAHGHMAVMRGVESGFSVARAAKEGYLTVSDDRGRILAETRSDSAGPFAMLVADVTAGHRGTLYLRLGDWFAWLVLAGLAFALARATLKM
jgi:apolipoprotein N-acyltransferase